MKQGHEENKSDNDEIIDGCAEAEIHEEIAREQSVESWDRPEITREECFEGWAGFQVTQESYLDFDFEISDGWGESPQVMNTLPAPRPRPGGGGGGSDGK